MLSSPVGGAGVIFASSPGSTSRRVIGSPELVVRWRERISWRGSLLLVVLSSSLMSERLGRRSPQRSLPSSGSPRRWRSSRIQDESFERWPNRRQDRETTGRYRESGFRRSASWREALQACSPSHLFDSLLTESLLLPGASSPRWGLRRRRFSTGGCTASTSPLSSLFDATRLALAVPKPTR